MSLPQKKKFERKKKFIKRCLKNQIMRREYRQKQRIAVCINRAKK